MTEPEDGGTRARRRIQDVGLLAGPALAGLAYLALPDAYAAPDGGLQAFGHAGRATAAVAAWMAVWWLCEAIPVYATALLPLGLFPLLGVASMPQAAAPYAHELIFLFMGGFLLALGMQRWGLHRRLALGALRWVGESPPRMVGGFMGVTAVLSMWVSNTATVLMMLPVATSVIDLLEQRSASTGSLRDFSLALLLGVAYAASIGGMATPIGTPPNVVLLSFLKTQLGIEIGFARWTLALLPFVAVFLGLAWLLLTKLLFRIRLERVSGGAELVRRSLRELGPMQRAERITLVVFAATAALWITRPLLAGIEWGGTRPLAGLSDAGIAMLAALALFVLPAGRDREFVLDWATTAKLPWGILVLFGGGLSLAAAIQRNGVGELIGAQVAAFAGVPSLVLLGIAVALIVLLTELTSNTATSATFIPIFAALASGLGLDPLGLCVPAALAASCAFMLPVATPPNAVVFGSGRIPIAEMGRAGIWLNAAAIGLLVAFGPALIVPLLASPG